MFTIAMGFVLGYALLQMLALCLNGVLFIWQCKAEHDAEMLKKQTQSMKRIA